MSNDHAIRYGIPLKLRRSEADALRAVLGAGFAWRPIRHTGDHSVFVGSQRGLPRWVLKLAEPVSFTRLAGQLAWARRLERLRRSSSAAARLGSLRASEWLEVDLGARRALLIPYVAGTPIGIERHLSSNERAAQHARFPQLLTMLGLLDELADEMSTDQTASAHDHESRFADHLAGAVSAGALDARQAIRMGVRFGRLSAGWSGPARFAHGELTPWHVIDTSDGLVLLDLETMGKTAVRYTDLSVLTMRIWALQGDHLGALKLLRAFYRTLSPAPQASFWADTHWIWLYAGARTLHDSQRWEKRAAARSFAAWCGRVSDPRSGEAALRATLA